MIAVLVAAAGRPVAVDSLLQAIYGDDASPSSRATLHTYVSNLRNVLGDVIVRRADAYLLDCSDATIDAIEFENVYNAALQVGSATDWHHISVRHCRCGVAIRMPTSMRTGISTGRSLASTNFD